MGIHLAAEGLEVEGFFSADHTPEYSALSIVDCLEPPAEITRWMFIYGHTTTKLDRSLLVDSIASRRINDLSCRDWRFACFPPDRG